MPTVDFWFLAGVAVLCVGIGQCNRMNNERFVKTPETAKAELLEACAMRVRLGYDVPGICDPQSHEAGRADRLDAQP